MNYGVLFLLSSVISVDHSRLEVKFNKVNLGGRVSLAHDDVAVYIISCTKGRRLIIRSSSIIKL